MKKVLAVPVFAYSDIQGAQITETTGSDETVRYMDTVLLKEPLSGTFADIIVTVSVLCVNVIQYIVQDTVHLC